MTYLEQIIQGRRKSSYINAFAPKSLIDIPKFKETSHSDASNVPTSESKKTEVKSQEDPRGAIKNAVNINIITQSSPNVSSAKSDDKTQPRANSQGRKSSKDRTNDSKRLSQSDAEAAKGASKVQHKDLSVGDSHAIPSNAPAPSRLPTRPSVFKQTPQDNDDDEEEDYRPVEFSSQFHEIIFEFANSKAYAAFILTVIFFNVGLLVSLTWDIVVIRCGWYFSAIDNILLGIYIMEVVLKLYAYRLKYFNSGWNIVDLLIVLFNVGDFGLPLVVQNISGFNAAAIFRILRIFRALRAIRALRVLRAIRFLSNLQVIMATILQSMRSIGAISALIFLFMYMFAVIGRGLYFDALPRYFGNLFVSFYTMFMLLTLDDWFEIYIQATDINPSSWNMILFLSLYVIIQYFVFLNLFVAVLTDNFQQALEKQTKENELLESQKKAAEDSDDEENYGEKPEESSDESEVEEVNVRTNIRDVNEGVPEDELDDVQDYLRLLVCLDYNMNILSEQQKIINLLVELSMETNDDV